jgi:hypothetical protein
MSADHDISVLNSLTKTTRETAMTDTELGLTTLAAIRDAFTSVREGHDRMSALKHSMA